jgi:hypothetical protein
MKAMDMFIALGSTPGSMVTPAGSHSIRVLFGRRKRDDLTDGIFEIAKIVRVRCADWDAHSNRPPQKGDSFIIGGRRYGVLSSDMKLVDDSAIAYVCEVDG